MVTTQHQPITDADHLSPPPSAQASLDGYDVAGWVFVSIVLGMYLVLVVYLSFSMYNMSQVALFFIVLIGSFAAPILVPTLFLLLMTCGIITERVRTVIY